MYYATYCTERIMHNTSRSIFAHIFDRMCALRLKPTPARIIVHDIFGAKHGHDAVCKTPRGMFGAEHRTKFFTPNTARSVPCRTQHEAFFPEHRTQCFAQSTARCALRRKPHGVLCAGHCASCCEQSTATVFFIKKPHRVRCA